MKLFKSNEIANSLSKKGFVQEPGDHKFMVFYYQGKPTTIRTKVSRGSKDPGPQLHSKMKRDLCFKKQSQFEDLIECPMSHEEYVSYLKREHQISP